MYSFGKLFKKVVFVYTLPTRSLSISNNNRHPIHVNRVCLYFFISLIVFEGVGPQNNLTGPGITMLP